MDYPESWASILLLFYLLLFSLDSIDSRVCSSSICVRSCPHELCCLLFYSSGDYCIITARVKIPDSIGVVQPLQFVLTVSLLAQCYPASTLVQELIPLLVTVPPGIVFGVWIVTSWSSTAIDCVLGLFLIVYTLLPKNNTDTKKRNKNAEANEEENDEEQRGVSCTSKLFAVRGKTLKRKTSDLELESILPPDMTEEEAAADEAVVTTPAPISSNMPTMRATTTSEEAMHHRHRRPPPHQPEKEEATTLSPPLRRRRRRRRKKRQPVQSKTQTMLANPTAVCAGFVGGALMGAFGTGGPAFLIYAKEAHWADGPAGSPKTFRANLQLLFLLINIPVMVTDYYETIVTVKRLHVSVYLLPALLLGGMLGTQLATRVPREQFQLLVITGLRLMGLMFLVEAYRA